MPAATPLTSPVVIFTVAMVVFPLVHAPPVVALLRIVVAPTHTLGVPNITPGTGLTVTVEVLRHPVESLYVTVAVPTERPEIPPENDIIGPVTKGAEDVHVPPVVALLSIPVVPVHSDVIPVIGKGLGWTVTAAVVAHPVDVML